MSSELDESLEKYIADENQQEQYYRKVLATDFYVPLAHDANQETIDNQGGVTPMVLESDEKAYIMMFDSVERLSTWAQKEMPYAILNGSAVARFSPAGLHWAINIGSKYAKEFVPDEINWLKQMAVMDPEA